MQSKSQTIKCSEFIYSISLGFWSRFSNLKLNQLKLNQQPLKIKGTYQFSKGDKAILELDQYSFTDYNKSLIKIKGGYLRSQSSGLFLNYNTLEQLKTAFSSIQEPISYVIFRIIGQHNQREDKKYSVCNICLLRSQKLLFFLLVKSQKLQQFIIISVAHLKSVNRIQMLKALPLSKYGYDQAKVLNIISYIVQCFQINLFQSAVESQIAKIQESDSNLIDQFLQFNEDEKCLEILNLHLNNQKPATILMLDPSNKLPSILIHSLFLQIYPEKIDSPKQFDIVLLRQKLTANLKGKTKLTDQNICMKVLIQPFGSKQVKHPTEVFPKIKCVKLKQFLDPKQLAAQAVWLNLKLMKWRAAPSLNLDAISPIKCLLFGSGSLGCQVSRQLLAWGFSNITLIDNGKISHSNPVRQSLFTYQNAANGNQFKSERAAKALLEICPSAKVKAINMTIPMPGHPPPASKQQIDHEYEKIMSDVENIQALVKEHDAIFLLTDNRQSRWLPTVLCALYDKICITAALGFDTYVVMRHGCVQQKKVVGKQSCKEERKNQQQRLGCYFCGDIVAPQNSMKDRTLDQQCTVSRPGKFLIREFVLALCPMASSWAVQLLVSMLNHPDKQRAKGHEQLFQCDQSILGPIPQQIRGNLRTFQNLALCGYSFEKCVACSSNILNAYTEDKKKLIRAVLQNSDLLEDISGITQMNQALDGQDIDQFVFD